MFDFLKPKHRHTEKIPIYFHCSKMPIFWGTHYTNKIDNDAITCYLHTCLVCGELLEYGKSAKQRGEKVGNYYTLTKSLRLARKIFKLKPDYLISKFTGDKYLLMHDSSGFYFVKKYKIVKRIEAQRN